jgi:tellurite resistance protein TerC
MGTWMLWISFNVFIVAMLALDLGLFHRTTHVVKLREALLWTLVWVTLALVFNGWLYVEKGPRIALEFFTGYLIEKSLSVDNVFVFALLFSYFSVPPLYQHKVLFWGVLGALLMRGVLIGAGAMLITQFAWILYVFGVFLIVTGVRMAFKKEEEIHPEQNPVVRLFKKLYPVSHEYHGDRFFAKVDGRHFATPLMVVLVCVEVTDVIFAVDSIPAIFSVTQDPFIVYTSNVFAILGLRSLYFALSGVMHLFRFLKVGLGLVLAFVGVKMLLAHTAWKIDTLVSLGVVAGVLVVAMGASVLWKEKPRAA